MSTKNPDCDLSPSGTDEDGNEKQRVTPDGRRRFVRDTLVTGGLLAVSVVMPDIGMRSAFAQQSTTTTLVPTTFPPTTTLVPTTFPPTTTTTVAPTTTTTVAPTTTTTVAPTTTTTVAPTTTLAPTTTAAPTPAIQIPTLGVAGLVALAAALGGGALIANQKLQVSPSDAAADNSTDIDQSPDTDQST